jgi:hypothetical protein
MFLAFSQSMQYTREDLRTYKITFDPATRGCLLWVAFDLVGDEFQEFCRPRRQLGARMGKGAVVISLESKSTPNILSGLF